MLKRNFNASILLPDGTRTVNTSEVLDKFVEFYQDLLGSRTVCTALDVSILNYGPCVADTDHDKLVVEVSEEEIKGAIFSIPDENATGPDGYSSQFFKQAWSMVRPVLVAAVK